MEIVIDGLELLAAGEVSTRVIKERITGDVTLTTFKRLATDENYVCGDDFLNWGKCLTVNSFLSTSPLTEVLADCVVPIEVILTPGVI